MRGNFGHNHQLISILRMKKIIPFYSVLLVFYSIVILVFIAVGSHGRIILASAETLRYLGIAFVFMLTSIVLLVLRRGMIKRWSGIVMIFFNVITIGLLCFQMNLLYPERFTVLSIFILSLHLLGLIFGISIIFKLLINLKKDINTTAR